MTHSTSTPSQKRTALTSQGSLTQRIRTWQVWLLVIVGIPLLMWGYSSWRKSHEERILAGIVAKGGQFTRSTTPFQQWVSQFTLLGRRLKFEGVPSDFTIPEPTDEELAYVGGMRLTHSLVILDRRIDDQILETVGRLPKLKHLTLKNCGVGDRELEQIIGRLKHPEHLVELNLKGTNLTDQGVSSIRRLTKLIALIIDESSIDGSGIQKLASKDLFYLRLSNSRVNDSNLKLIANRWGKILQVLDLSNSQISDAGLNSIVFLPCLNKLRIGGTSITPEGMQGFLRQRSELPIPARKIELLSFADFPWTIENLKKISLPDSLQELDLTGWTIQDADIDQLPNIEKLQTLNLSRTGITDAGLPALKGFPQLRNLHLRGTRVTNTGLKVALEHARINSLAVGESQITFEGLMTYSGSWSRATIDVSGMDLTLEQLRLLAEQRLPWRAVIDRDRIFTRH